MSQVDGERVAELRATVLGPVITPDDSGYEKPSPFWVGACIPKYDEARKVWNGLIDHKPAIIVQCQLVSDIQAALAFARANDLTISVRGGGHGATGANTVEDGLVIDLSRLRGVHVDVEQRTAVAAAGSLLAELDRETQIHGLATTAGTVSHTGIAGLTLYGGIGRLMRKYGLTVDNVIGYDVVTADGVAQRVDAAHHPDLFWALRGGGASFCIVTHFHYQLHPVGPIVYGGYLGWPLEQAKDVYLAIRDHIDGAPDDLQVQYIFTTAPVAEFIPAELQGVPALIMTATWVGEDLDEGATWIAPLQEHVPPTLNLVGQFPYTMLQSGSDPLAPHGRLATGSYDGYFDELTEEIFDVAVGEARTFVTKFSFIEFSQLGGAVGRVPADATPAAEFRGGKWLWITGSNTEDPDQVEECQAWNYKSGQAFEPYRRTGRYVNFFADDSEEGIREALGDDTYARLKEIKAKYDPDAVFSYNPNTRSVQLPAQPV